MLRKCDCGVVSRRTHHHNWSLHFEEAEVGVRTLERPIKKSKWAPGKSSKRPVCELVPDLSKVADGLFCVFCAGRNFDVATKMSGEKKKKILSSWKAAARQIELLRQSSKRGGDEQAVCCFKVGVGNSDSPSSGVILAINRLHCLFVILPSRWENFVFRCK